LGIPEKELNIYPKKQFICFSVQLSVLVLLKINELYIKMKVV